MNPMQSMDVGASEKCSASSEEEFVLAGDEGASMELEASDRKRKIEEVSDDSDDSDDCYDSSDEYESVKQEESDESEEETEAADNSDSDSEIEDEFLISAMPDSRFSPTEKINLLPKIRRYLKSVSDTEGYGCKSFPGFILGITSVVPRKSVIRRRDRYPEGYNRVMYLSALALKHYNEKESTTFVVENVIDANGMMSLWNDYLLTFTATECERTQTFRACVSCNSIEGTINVESCDIKPGSVPTRKTTRQGFECYFAEDEKTDPLTEISSLSCLSDEELLVKIKKEALLGHPLTEISSLSCLSDEKTDPAKQKNILLKKVRKYFKSVLDSKGFECRYYPGHIPGVTYLKPREKIADMENNHREGYDHLKRMGMLGLDYYFKQKGKPEHDYMVIGLNNATLWKESSCSYFYYVTFRATKVDYDEDGLQICNPTEIFQVKVHDTQRDIQVLLVNKLEGYTSVSVDPAGID